MLEHFKKMQASINSVEPYPLLSQQASRFLEAGWSHMKIARNLWDLWSDDHFTPPSVRQSLDTIEPFDEWEELALYGSHYSLLVASNESSGPGNEASAEYAGTHTQPLVGYSKDTDAECIALLHWISSSGAPLTPRRFNAAFSAQDGVVFSHGGQSTQTRLSSIDVLESGMSQPIAQPCTSVVPTARMCHTVTRLAHVGALLVGGRASPTQALNDCWLLNEGHWTKVDDLPTGRYRHCAVAITLENEGSKKDGVMIHGGKDSNGTALNDALLWTSNSGWQAIPVTGPLPPPRFGAAMSRSSSNQNWGLFMGGIGSSGTVLDDVWEWSVAADPTPQLKYTNRTNDIRSRLPKSAYSRIGASLLPWGNSLLLIGGISQRELRCRSEDLLLLTHSDTGIIIDCPKLQLDSTWPLLVGMGAVSVSAKEIVIAGGGAVCFSMGSFWNSGYLSITSGDEQGARLWRSVPHDVQVTPTPQAQGRPQSLGAQSKKTKDKGKKKAVPVRTAAVPRVRVSSAEQFASVVANAKPVIIKGLDFGRCTDLWTLDYLKSKIGTEREIVVHECSSDRMTFKDKNFQYVKKSVTKFLDGIAAGSPEYLRAISSEQPNKLPTKLEEDFPTIAEDFHIPSECEMIKDKVHSSPLRVSGPVSLWLHYDVLANILCQIHGKKTLHLYPPSDVKYLDYPPGGSSSNTDVLTSQDPKLRYTHPQIASLKPGDILFIPPMWSHTATPEDGVSVAVNVFWKDLEKGYAAGKDVYGNRDLQAYENGRRDVEKIVRAFKDVPADLARFYLDRLAGEIQERAEKMERKQEQKTEQKVEEGA